MRRVKCKGAKWLRAWRRGMDLSLVAFGAMVKDGEGWQVRKFELGDRNLPLELAVRVARVTGIPIVDLLSPKQLKTFSKISQLMDRDAAA